MIFDVAIIGAGASGLMAASRIKKGSVAIIDGNDGIGKKIIVSGGGKCNVTNENVTPEHYDGDREFFRTSFEKLNNRDLLAMFKSGNVIPTKQNRVVKNQFFCKTSKEVTDFFKKRTKHCKLFLNERVVSLSKEQYFRIKTKKQTIAAHRVIIASGSISYEQLGATGIGHDIAEQFGHEITRLDPALVGFTVLPEQRWFKELSGLSTEVIVTVGEKRIKGNLLCAHKGITGPAIMVASLYWKKGKISLDFIPGISTAKLLKGNDKRNLSTALPLPKRFTKALLDALNIKDKPLFKLTKEDRENIEKIKNYEFAPAGTFGFKRAEVTRGGVSTEHINPDRLESTLQDGLFFTGEVLDITGELGGYNLQWAFSSGYSCGEYINSIL